MQAKHHQMESQLALHHLASQHWGPTVTCQKSKWPPLSRCQNQPIRHNTPTTPATLILCHGSRYLLRRHTQHLLYIIHYRRQANGYSPLAQGQRETNNYIFTRYTEHSSFMPFNQRSFVKGSGTDTMSPWDWVNQARHTKLSFQGHYPPASIHGQVVCVIYSPTLTNHQMESRCSSRL